ncbi:MAG: hypothetical protein WCH62_09305, partial [Candidatus Omnitrophota bacterium]
ISQAARLTTPAGKHIKALISNTRLRVSSLDPAAILLGRLFEAPKKTSVGDNLWELLKENSAYKRENRVVRNLLNSLGVKFNNPSEANTYQPLLAYYHGDPKPLEEALGKDKFVALHEFTNMANTTYFSKDIDTRRRKTLSFVYDLTIEVILKNKNFTADSRGKLEEFRTSFIRLTGEFSKTVPGWLYIGDRTEPQEQVKKLSGVILPYLHGDITSSVFQERLTTTLRQDKAMTSQMEDLGNPALLDQTIDLIKDRFPENQKTVLLINQFKEQYEKLSPMERNCAEVFIGLKSQIINVLRILNESDGEGALLDVVSAFQSLQEDLEILPKLTGSKLLREDAMSFLAQDMSKSVLTSYQLRIWIMGRRLFNTWKNVQLGSGFKNPASFALKEDELIPMIERWNNEVFPLANDYSKFQEFIRANDQSNKNLHRFRSLIAETTGVNEEQFLFFNGQNDILWLLFGGHQGGEFAGYHTRITDVNGQDSRAVILISTYNTSVLKILITIAHEASHEDNRWKISNKEFSRSIVEGFQFYREYYIISKAAKRL